MAPLSAHIIIINISLVVSIKPEDFFTQQVLFKYYQHEEDNFFFWINFLILCRLKNSAKLENRDFSKQIFIWTFFLAMKSQKKFSQFFICSKKRKEWRGVDVRKCRGEISNYCMQITLNPNGEFCIFYQFSNDFI